MTLGTIFHSVKVKMRYKKAVLTSLPFVKGENATHQVAEQVILAVVYRKLKYSAEAEVFHYFAFSFGRRSFILNIRPSVLS